jgi:hypothetical protein
MNEGIRKPSDASFDAMTEQPMHPFTENEVITALERLHATLNKWRALRQSGDDNGTALTDCGDEVVQDVGGAVVAFQTARKRRRKELAAEYRTLAKPALYRE